MHTRHASARSRRLALALLATLSASAALFAALPASAAQTRFDPYTQGQGAIDKADPFTQGADRQVDTVGTLSWKYDRFDPYGQSSDRQTTHDLLAWHGDTSYPSGAQGART